MFFAGNVISDFSAATFYSKFYHSFDGGFTEKTITTWNQLRSGLWRCCEKGKAVCWLCNLELSYSSTTTDLLAFHLNEAEEAASQTSSAKRKPHLTAHVWGWRCVYIGILFNALRVTSSELDFLEKKMTAPLHFTQKSLSESGLQSES